MTIDLLDEAVLGVQVMAYRLIDDEGRPLGEINALDPAALDLAGDADADDDDADPDDDNADEGISFDLATAPYPGCRAGLDMNVSALRQVNQHWANVLADLSWIHDRHAARSNRHAVTLLDLLRIGEVATAMPAWLSRRGVAVPGRAAAQFKVSQGIVMVCRPLVFEGRGDELLDPAALVREAEQRRLFVGSGRACAGAPHLVEELFRVATGGRVAASTPPIADVLEDADAFFDYALIATAMFQLGLAPRYACNAALVAARDALAAAASPSARELGSALAQVRPLAPAYVDGALSRLRRELAWRGLDPETIPRAASSPPPAACAALEARLAAANLGLAGAPAHALARAALACQLASRAVQPTLAGLAQTLGQILRAGSVAPAELGPAQLVGDLWSVLQRLGTEPL